MRKNQYLTIKEIARIAGVSPSTVSLVLNERPGIGEETRYRVQQIIKSFNYRPNLVARSLVKGRSYAVAMLVTSPLNPIFPELAAGVDGVLKERGDSLSIISTYDDPEVEANEFHKIRARGVDGIITSAALLDSDALKTTVQSEYPVVSVLRRVYDCENLDFVTVDNLKGGYLAIEHIIRLGHTRIGIIKGPQNTSTGRERFEGSLLALQDYDIPEAVDLIAQGDFFKNSGYLATNRFLKMPMEKRPTAIYAGNDEMALGAFEAIWDMGMKIPQEIALIGFNNIETTALRSVEISTISQRKQEMGRLAAKRLIDKIEKNRGYHKPYQIVLDPEPIIRKSCGFSSSSKYIKKKKNRHW